MKKYYRATLVTSIVSKIPRLEILHIVSASVVKVNREYCLCSKARRMSGIGLDCRRLSTHRMQGADFNCYFADDERAIGGVLACGVDELLDGLDSVQVLSYTDAGQFTLSGTQQTLYV